MAHVVLLGDSVFDNGAYVGRTDPDVAQQLGLALGEGHRVTRVAVDGHVMAHVPHQLDRIPADATHLVVSVGGNDALGVLPILAQGTDTVGDGLAAVAEEAGRFSAGYRDMLGRVCDRGLPVAVCTIYDPCFDHANRDRLGPTDGLGPAAVAGLAAFNDAILRHAVSARVPVVDLRVIFTHAADYANPIEPSAIGGAKLAATIAALVASNAFDAPWSAVVGSV